jgi:hypothetical protein
MVRVAEAHDDPLQKAVGYFCLGDDLFFSGALEDGIANMERCLATEPASTYLALLHTGVDLPVSARCMLALMLWHRGEEARALELVDEATERARVERQVFGINYALYFTCWVLQLSGDRTRVEKLAREIISDSTKHGFVWALIATVFLGWATGGSQGIEQIRGASGRMEALRIRLGSSHVNALLAETLLRDGCPEEAAEVLRQALRHPRASEERFFDAELHRLLGEALIASASENRGEGTRELRAARDIARRLGMCALEARAAASLAVAAAATL